MSETCNCEGVVFNDLAAHVRSVMVVHALIGVLGTWKVGF